MNVLQDIIFPILAFLGLGAAMGGVLAIAAKVFEIKEDPTVTAVLEVLPGANCGGCGYAGCEACAKAIAEGAAKPSACTVGGHDTAAKIGEILGVEVGNVVKLRAQVMCSGTSEYAKKKYVYRGATDCIAAAKMGGGDKLCPNGCIGLGTCTRACPYGAIRIVNGVAAVDYKQCIGCGVCVAACPKHIICLIPYDSFHWVGCSAVEAGKEVRKYCDVGCISCKICEKNCPSGAIKVSGTSASIDYSVCNGCNICVTKCPRKIIWSAERQGEIGLAITRIKE